MQQKLKAKKCRSCKREYDPKVEWQRFCSPKCSWTDKNNRNMALIRKAKKIEEAEAQ